MKLTQVAPETATRLNASLSFTAIAVLVKSVTVELSTAVPVDSDTPEVLIELAAVGIAVAEDERHVLIVTVPVSAAICQLLIEQANGRPGR